MLSIIAVGGATSGIIIAVTSAGVLINDTQGFMQDQIIASHTCFGGHMDVNW